MGGTLNFSKTFAKLIIFAEIWRSFFFSALLPALVCLGDGILGAFCGGEASPRGRCATEQVPPAAPRVGSSGFWLPARTTHVV